MKRIIVLLICLLSVFSMKAQYDESYIKEFTEGCKKIETYETLYTGGSMSDNSYFDDNFARNSGTEIKGWITKEGNLFGPCKVINKDKMLYKNGTFINNKMVWFGTYEDRDKSIKIKGQFKNNKLNGFAIYEKFKKISIWGKFKDGVPDGYSIQSSEDKNIKSGFYKLGQFNISFQDSIKKIYTEAQKDSSNTLVDSLKIKGGYYFGEMKEKLLNGWGFADFYFDTIFKNSKIYKTQWVMHGTVLYSSSIKFWIPVLPNSQSVIYETYHKDIYDLTDSGRYEYFDTDGKTKIIDYMTEEGNKHFYYNFVSQDHKGFNQFIETGEKDDKGLMIKNGYDLYADENEVTLILWENNVMKEFWRINQKGKYIHVKPTYYGWDYNHQLIGWNGVGCSFEDTNRIYKDCYLCVYRTGNTFEVGRAYNPTIPGTSPNEAKKEKVYSVVDLKKTIKINQTCANMISQEIK